MRQVICLLSWHPHMVSWRNQVLLGHPTSTDWGSVIEEVLAVAGGRADESDGRRVEAYS